MKVIVRREHLRKMWEVLAIITAVLLLVFQISQNIRTYLAKPTVFKLSLLANEIITLPPVTVCPFPPFRPDKLRDLGVNISGSYMDVESNLASLKNIQEDMAVSRLWNEAHWALGQVVESVILGNKTVTYNSSTTSSPLWRRSFSPLGPCYTFIPPPRETEITIHLVHVPYLKPCTLTLKDGLQYSYQSGVTNCDSVERNCNSTCGFEDYLHTTLHGHDLAFVYFHDTAALTIPESETEEDIIKFSEQIFKGRYDVLALEKDPSLRSQVHLVEKAVIKDNCVPDNSYSVGECYLQHQKALILEKLGCISVDAKVFNQSISSTCSSPQKIMEMYRLDPYIQQNCSTKCYSKSWIHEVTDLWFFKFAIFLSTSSNDIRREEEIETYPLSQLISDTGGSLGLFLSISVLFGWKFIILCIQQLSHVKKSNVWENPHFHNLMKCIGITTLLAASCVHCLQVLRIYVLQPRLTSVMLMSSVLNDSSDIKTSVARRLASRALNCQQQETPYEESLVQCLLKDAVDDVASVVPFINLDDVPPCEERNYYLSLYEYVIPSEMLIAATLPKRIEKCIKIHKTEQRVNVSNEEVSRINMHINYNYHSMDILQLICSLGGVIGLYLGFSAFEIIDFVREFSSKGNKGHPGKFWYKSSGIVKVIIFFLTFIFILLMVIKFSLYHLFTASVISGPPDHVGKELALTLCRWPPFDLQKLSDNLGFNMSENLFLKMPKQERLSKIREELEFLHGNWNSSLNHIWNESSWHISDFISIYLVYLKNGQALWGDCDNEGPRCKDIWPRVLTMLNMCITFNSTSFNSTLSKIVLTFPAAVEKRSLFGMSPQIYFAISPVGEPPLLTELIPKYPYERIIASLTAVQYKSLSRKVNKENNSSTTYRNCIHDCIYNDFFSIYNCYLPYMPKHPFGKSCNQTTYKRIPKYYKGLEVLSQGWSNMKQNDSTSQGVLYRWKSCYTSCRHLHSTFYEWSLERIPDPYPTLEINFPQDDSVTLKETESYNVSQLISDIGGIAGITVGFSLLMLLKNIIPRIFKDTLFNKR